MAAYVIADIEVIDTVGYEEYRQKAPATISAYGGRYVARGGATEVLEGTWTPRRCVILEFPSMVQLKACGRLLSTSLFARYESEQPSQTWLPPKVSERCVFQIHAYQSFEGVVTGKLVPAAQINIRHRKL